MIETTLFQYNPWWIKEYEFSAYERRDILSKMDKIYQTNLILVLTGLRRIGKTTLMKLYIKKLIKEGINPKNILYISLDDYSLNNYSLQEIVVEFRKINDLGLYDKVYLFFDEITYMKQWEQQLKNIFDLGNCKIVVSSSSSSILKDNKAFLTGRTHVIEVLPLDFSEYLEIKNIQISKAESYLREKYFEEYMKTGGVPIYVLTTQREIIVNIVNDIIYKDIIGKHEIKNIRIIEDYFMLLMERSGKQLSLNNIGKILNISADTAKRYYEMFLETYLIYSMERYGKTNEKIVSPKKVYASDLGIRVAFTGYRDIGSLFENYVFLKIRDLKPGYIYENGIELDFMTESKSLIEVKYNGIFNDKQKGLFERIEANEKNLVDGILEFETLFSKIRSN